MTHFLKLLVALRVSYNVNTDNLNSGQGLMGLSYSLADRKNPRFSGFPEASEVDVLSLLLADEDLSSTNLIISGEASSRKS